MLDLIIKAALEAAKEASERGKSQDERLRQENDARLAAEWAHQQVMNERNARAAAPPPVARSKKKQKSSPPPLHRPQVQQVVSRTDTARQSSASAATIATWAQPRTLRSQFILTEILKPPLSMRKRG